MSFTENHLYYEDVEVGQEWESLGRTLTETDIVNFAGLSGDFNPIHTDREFAKTALFGQPIAHGLLVLAISSGLGVNYPLMRTMALLSIREWNFKGPVFIGDTLKVRTKVLAKETRARGRRGIITWGRQLMNQDGKVVQEGSAVTMVETRVSRSEGEDAEGGEAS
jgi:acyl dehydratase